MTTSFPGALDAYTQPTEFDDLDSAGVFHDLLHQNELDAIAALEIKVGIDGSSDSDSLEYKINQRLLLSAQPGIDRTNTNPIDAAFQAVLDGMQSGDCLVVDRGTYKIATGNFSLGGKHIALLFQGGWLSATTMGVGVALFNLGAGDIVTVTGQGRIRGPGKLVSTLNTNAFTLTNAPGALFLMGNIEIDGWYHGVRPDSASAGVTVLGANIHDNAFSAGFPHAGDWWDIRCSNNGTTLLHHDLYVSSDGGTTGARGTLKVRSTGCAGAAIQLFSTTTVISGFDCHLTVEAGYGAYAIGDFDVNDCTFHVNARGCTDRAFQVLGNVHACEFTGTIKDCVGRNIDVTNNGAGRPTGNIWNVVSEGGGDAGHVGAVGVTNMFSGQDSSLVNIVAKDSIYDCVRFSGSHYNKANVVASGSLNGDGFRLSGGSHDNDIDLNSQHQHLYDLDISPNNCANNTVRGRGASHAFLPQNINVDQGTTGLDLDGFRVSYSSGAGGPATPTTAYQAVPSEIILANSSTRTITDGTIATNTSLVSVTASFTQADVNRKVTGTGIVAGTTILSVTNGTTAVLSTATTATASGVTVVIGGFIITLPPSAGLLWVRGKKVDAGAGVITFVPTTGTIDGSSNLTLTTSTTLMCDGTNWLTL